MNDGRHYLVSQARALKLDLPVPYQEMLAEAQALRSYFTEYRADGEVYKGWHTLTLHGFAYDKGYSWENYKGIENANAASAQFKWTEIADKCPATINWLQTVFPSNRFGRVRFMLLEAGGQIGFHKDTDHPIVEMVNIALSHPPECVWHWDNGTTLDFKPGDAYAVNISYPHSVVNNSTEDRYHIIVHHHDSTEEWMNLMKKALEDNNEQGEFFYSEELY